MTEKQRFREILFEIELRKRKEVQKLLTENGLTPGQGQARILKYLEEHDGVTQREVAGGCLLDVTTMSRVLDKLEKMGLIQRRRDPENRRSYRICLTEAGRQKSEQIQEGFRNLEERMCRGIPDEETKKLCAGLEKVLGNLRLQDSESVI